MPSHKTPKADRPILTERSYFKLLIRPEIAFAITWVIVLSLYSLDIVDFFPPPQWKVLATVAGSLTIGIIFAALWRRHEKKHQSYQKYFDLASMLANSRPILYSLLAIWIVGYIFIVLYSGGVPMYWYAAKIPKTYIEYGVPTFSGAWNTLRIVISIIVVFCLVRAQRLDFAILLTLAFLTLTVTLEVNRGGLVLYGLNIFAAGVLAAPTLKRQLLWIASITFVIVSGVVVMGSVRANTPQLQAEAVGGFAPENGDPATGLRLEMSKSQGAAWIYFYMTTPLANLYYAATQELEPPPYPGFYTLYPMAPTILRPEMPPERRYPLPLLKEGYTMTTAYGPSVADFGFWGASVLMGLQLALGALVFSLARRHLWALIVAPMLFATTVLGFFTNYFFTLLMPFHVFLAIAVSMGLMCMNIYKDRNALGLERSE